MVYKYQDANDLVPHGAEPVEGYWLRSEEAILKHSDAICDGAGRPRRFLDAGCGDGRLLARFVSRFEQVTAIDCDSERLAAATRTAAAAGIADKIQFACIPIEVYKGGPFKFVLCNHVIQHVSTGVVPKILANCRRLLAEDGLLLLTTTHSKSGHDYFVRVRLENGVPYETQLSEHEFNAYAGWGVPELPVRYVTGRTLRELVESQGFKIVFLRVYHELGNLGDLTSLFDRDWLINLHEDLQDRLGHDIAVFARPA